MNIRQILKDRGLDDTNIETLVTNPAYASVLEGFVTEAENGKTAYLKAQEIETNLKKWNDETVIPYGQKKDQEAAQARAEAAKYKTYLSELKAQGYEVPDSYLDASSNPVKLAEVVPAARDYSDDIMNSAKANMALISMSERARDLLGHGLDVENEYEDFGKNKRPGENLRSYIDRKYDLAGKQQAKEAETKKKYEDGIRDEARKSAIAEYEQKHGSNGETVIPSASKFDKFKDAPQERKNAWQTQDGRESQALARQEKYRNFLVQ